MPIKVLMLNNEYPPLGGGTATINEELLKTFAKRSDIELVLITSSAVGQREELRATNNTRIIKVAIRRNDIHHAGNFELLHFAYLGFLEARRLLKVEKFDICLAWCSVPAGLVAYLLKYLFGLNYFVRVSGPDIPGFEKRYRLLYPLLGPLVRLIWRKAQGVVTKCAEEGRLVSDLEPRAKIFEIQNAVDTNKFSPPALKVKVPLLRVLAVGRLVERKGQRFLLEVAAQLKKKGLAFELHLIGTGDDLTLLKQQALDLDIAKEVLFHGYVERAEILKHYQAADVFALPSWNEGMSVALLEAMACALPVVVSEVGGVAELVSDGINGFICPKGSVAAFSEALLKLADEALAQRLGQAAFVRAKQQSWAVVEERYLNLFNSKLD